MARPPKKAKAPESFSDLLKPRSARGSEDSEEGANQAVAETENESDAASGDDLDNEDLAFSEEDAVLDRRIIEGMLKDKDALIKDLVAEGMKPDEIMRRAADLGISEALLRQVRGVEAELAGGDRAGPKGAPPRLAARICLSCDRVFLSTGPGNRLCMRCRGGDAGLAQF